MFAFSAGDREQAMELSMAMEATGGVADQPRRTELMYACIACYLNLLGLGVRQRNAFAHRRSRLEKRLSRKCAAR